MPTCCSARIAGRSSAGQAIGKTAKQLREEYGITKKDNLRDCFNADEISKVQSVEMIVSGLVNCGWGYDEIKGFIVSTKNKLIPAYR